MKPIYEQRIFLLPSSRAVVNGVPIFQIIICVAHRMHPIILKRVLA